MPKVYVYQDEDYPVVCYKRDKRHGVEVPQRMLDKLDAARKSYHEAQSDVNNAFMKGLAPKSRRRGLFDSNTSSCTIEVFRGISSAE